MPNNVTTDEMETALTNLAQSMGLSVKEYVEGGFLDLTTYGQDKANILARLDAIDVISDEDDIETLAEKIKSINTVLSNDEGQLQGILDLINVNKSDIATEKARAKGVEAGLRTDVDNALAKGVTNANDISDIQTALSDLEGVNTVAVDELKARVTDTESQIATLEADATVEGSVDNKIAVETARAKSVSGTLSDLTTEDKTNLVGAINEVQSEVNLAQAGVNSAMAKAEENATAIAGVDKKYNDILEDTTDADDNLVKGIKTRVTDVENAIATETTARTEAMTAQLEELKAYSDARDLKASSMNICAIGNAFRGALGLGDKTCDGNDGDGEAI